MADKTTQAERLMPVEAGRTWGPASYGARDGETWAADPYAMAKAEGVTVKAVTPARLCAERGLKPRAENLVAGFYAREDWPDMPTVYVDCTMTAREQALTVAHELAHMHHAAWNEEACELYARFFVDALSD